VLQKIVPVYGDISQENLGMSPEHLKLVQQESQIVFHMAASLKLEATLKPNVEMNLLGTRYALEVCKKMPKLIVVLHLSTAFCTCDEEKLYERVYDWHHDPNEVLRSAEWMDEKTMELVQSQLMGPHPNTYTYTKRLAEILVQREYDSLPLCIVRPSIVTPAWQEPLPGWVDNLNGPVGIMVSLISRKFVAKLQVMQISLVQIAAAKGVLRSLLVDGRFKGECIPVDFAINGIIGIAKSVAEKQQK